MAKKSPFPKEIPLENQESTTLDSNLLLGHDPVTSLLDDFVLPKSPKEIKHYYHSPYFLFSAQLIIILTFVVFAVMTFLNLLVNKSIDQKKESLLEKTQQLEASDTSFLNLKEISDKIAIHKVYKSEFTPISPVLSLFKEELSDLEYKDFSLNGKKAIIEAQTKSPLTFSLLTNKYLTSGFVNQVILKSASLDKSTQKYNLSMEVSLE